MGIVVLYPFKLLLCLIPAVLLLWITVTKSARRAVAIGSLAAAFAIWSAPWVYVAATSAWNFNGRCGMKRRYACTLGEFMWMNFKSAWPLLLFDLVVFAAIALVFARNWKRSRAPAQSQALLQPQVSL